MVTSVTEVWKPHTAMLALPPSLLQVEWGPSKQKSPSLWAVTTSPLPSRCPHICFADLCVFPEKSLVFNGKILYESSVKIRQ
jgi:hypothetical protein